MQALKLSVDGATIESYTRSGSGGESHSTAVNQMKEHINEAGLTPEVAELDLELDQ